MASAQLDHERRAWGGSVPRDAVERDPLYLLIVRCLEARGVRQFTLRWPEIDQALRDAVVKHGDAETRRRGDAEKGVGA
jgi:hypothetical protein